MGMCVVKGPRVLRGEEQVGDGELSPRSTVSSGGYGSAASSSSSSHEEEEEMEVPAQGSSFVSPLWQRTIPKGRRCKPLSFSGVIVYDENGNRVEVEFEEDEDEDEEYFSPQPRNLAQQAFEAAE